MRNNIIAFFFHLLYSFLTLIFTIWFVSSGPTLGKFTTSFPARVFFISLFIIGYVFIGMLLSSNKPKNYDFFYGVLIVLVGLIIWAFAFSKAGMNIGVISKQYGEYWMLFNLFFSPFNLIYFFLDISVTPILLLFTTVFPSLLMGIGIKIKKKLVNTTE